MAIAHAKLAPTVRVVDIVAGVEVVVFVPSPKLKPSTPSVQLKQPLKPMCMLGNVKPSPKKERGVKEVAVVMVIAGNMGNKMEDTGNRRKEKLMMGNLADGSFN